jgi:hypothetical protein
MSDDEIAQIRSLTESVLERARNDEAYLEELRTDPVATLQAAGLDEVHASHIGLEEFRPEEEVSGFAKSRACRMTEDGLGCFITWCTALPVTW